ncbi:uncharacterized protein C8A04DRAFT_24745 [Dichotomopilus funicola]|uniref:Cupin type-2 domain-containing protein n=1 Tax=Dichotomopilus funicola TaxID=1934379 RepID=A0AAN6VA20_9PEZI|nr:hypothetical protein C8A04DRAFT_24745 [Dichotomopilus funicola]
MPIRGPISTKLYKKDVAETLRVGPLTIRVYEDGSLTENRVSAVLLELPAGTSGPPMHWHRFHDELFLVTKDGEVTAAAGDLMTVPPGAVHTFKNASETEACECHYVDYFRMLSKATKTGNQLGPAEVEHFMALFGTFPPSVESEP